ncbi:DUF4097 family beta strand repeat-containing protein [Nocardia niigatensis]|uniref:DUF4097 family beta strand repeat-containing protein n=1 Tax=Nocardia niigatensis TaxID=209249 RepID=UPI0002F2CC6F|nr:hypothetical protein [Nocardia niigatensis]
MTAFQTPEAITVALEVAAGNVTVIASDRTDTIVEIRPADAAKKEDVRASEQIRVEFSAGALTVQAPTGWRKFSPLAGKGSVEVTIEVPAGSRVTGSLGMGRLLGAGPLGFCELEVSAGDITVERPLGSVTAKVAKGDIRIVEATRGLIDVETATGDLSIGINPGSAARLETNAQQGTIQNQLYPVTRPQDIVEVHARNSYGNISIGHTTAA